LKYGASRGQTIRCLERIGTVENAGKTLYGTGGAFRGGGFGEIERRLVLELKSRGYLHGRQARSWVEAGGDPTKAMHNYKFYHFAIGSSLGLDKSLWPLYDDFPGDDSVIKILNSWVK